jgi:thioredoxin 1
MERNEESMKRVVLGEGFAIQADEKSFDQIISTSDKPVLVDFWADWCGPCKMLAPVLDEFAAEYADEMKVVKVELEKAPMLQERFDIMSIPTMMVFVDGSPVQTIVGARDKQLLTKEMEHYLTK